MLFLLTTLILCDYFLGTYSDTVSSSIFENLNDVADKLPRDYCTYQFMILNEGLSKGEEWALRMIDASAKPQSGLLKGNIFQIGNYDECLEVKTKVTGQEIAGQYCTVFLKPHPEFGKDLNQLISGMMSGLNMNEDGTNVVEDVRLSYGLCVPKICTVEVLQNISNVLSDSFKYPLQLNFEEDFCDGGDPKPHTSWSIFAIVVFSLFAVVIAFSTLYDAFVYRKLDPSQRQPDLLVSFSVLTNGENLFDTKKSGDELSCLNGMKVISMMWVVLCHTFRLQFYVPHINLLDIVEKWKYEKSNALIIGSSMSVDTFFVIGGLLVVYTFMKNRSKGVKFSLPMYYLHRILRLTPALAMLVLFTSTLVIYMGNGPFWPAAYIMLQKGCETHWWHTLLYLQNYLSPVDELCLEHTWYLAVDFHMYILSPLILFPLVKWPKVTIAALSALVLGLSGYVFAITWVKHPGTTFFDQTSDFSPLIYCPTHVRGCAYLIGMICGYFVCKTRTSTPLKLTQFRVIVLWLSSLAVMLGIVFSHSSMIDNDNALDAAFFNALIRPGWSIVLSVVILLCVNGYGGLINTFLSYKIFTVLIRLNYSIYLVHVVVMEIVLSQSRTATYVGNLFIYGQFWGDYMFSVGAAIVWTLAFELPVLMIEKIVFGKKKDVNPNGNVVAHNKTGEELGVVHVVNYKEKKSGH